MKIGLNYALNFNFSKNNNKKNQTNKSYVQSPIKAGSYFDYQNYDINALSFKARLNRTPENFYEQEFNRNNMPDTVRNYLFEDYETRRHMPPAQLQRQAFEYIKIADTVDEVKEMYPDEPLFKNLKSFDDTKASHGILLLLRWDKQTSNTPVFKNKEEKDLALYLLKKVYIEGKTIDEINKDFDNDATDEIKKELGIKDGRYFTDSTLRAMGVRYPNLSYYNSFLATRNDKEYVPPVRKPSETPRTVSEETKEKLSIASKKWWAGLNEIEREEQIQKMMEGKEFADSIFTKFQGQIMTIAAAKIGFSERLSQIFADKMNDEEFNQDFPTFAEKSREIMLEFWNKDPDFKEQYSKATRDTISDFETAYYDKENPQNLENLLNLALELKAKILEKAKIKQHQRQEMQKLAPKPAEPQEIQKNKENDISNNNKQSDLFKFENYSRKDINKLFRQNELKLIQIYPDTFAKALFEFMTRNNDFKTKQLSVILQRPDAKEILKVNDDELVKIINDFHQKSEDLNHKFDEQNTLLAKTNEFLLNEFLFQSTRDPKVFFGERGDAYDQIKAVPELKEELIKTKQTLNQQFKKLAKPMNTNDSLEFLNKAVIEMLKYLCTHKSEFYTLPENFDINVSTIENGIANSTKFRNESIKFIQNYNAYIKFLKQNKQPELHNNILEHIAIDYFIFVMKNHSKQEEPEQKTQLSPDANQKAGKTKNVLNRKYNLNLSSEKSVKNAARILLKEEMRCYSPEFQEKLTDFILNHPDIDKNTLTAFISIESKLIDKLKQQDDLTEKVKEGIKQLFTNINKEFDKKYPLESKANEFALNQTIFDITHDLTVLENTRKDSLKYIKDKGIEAEVINKKPLIEKRYRDYSKGLNDSEASEFFENTIKQKIEDLYDSKEGFKFEYHKDIALKNQMELLRLLMYEIPTENIIDYLKCFKGAVDFIQDNSQPENAREFMKEHIVYYLMCELIPNLITG